ncbi:hypothetical protein HD554DRAFT_539148 [Boletus coccyginus]|nr:hypothetical protein HD554DRAFT_539148 [Boletus coccyginus]
MTGVTAAAQEDAWKLKERGEEARYACEKEQAQLSAIRAQKEGAKNMPSGSERERDFEGGFGGQEDLEDRYATTSGEH